MTATKSEIIFHQALLKKKKEFRHFSLRWMAKKLDISHAYLSQILNNKRPIPVDKVEAICTILDIDESHRAQIYLETYKGWGYQTTEKSRTTRIYGWSLAKTSDFDLISRWEPMAILLVIRLKDFDGTTDFIAKKLGLPIFFIKMVIELLLERGFLGYQNERLTPSEAFFEFQSKASKIHIRRYQRSVLSEAIKMIDTRIDDPSVHRRHIVSGAMTCSNEVAQRLKLKINDFLKQCVEESAESPPEQVYQLALQLLPVTE